MAKFDFGKGLKDLQSKIQDSAETVKKSARDIKFPEKVDLEGMKDIAGKAADSAKKAAETMADSTRKAVEDVGKNLDAAAKKRLEKKEQLEAGSMQVLSTETAIKIIYYLIAADGEINEDEIEKFNEICVSLDPKFEDYRDALMDSCRMELEKTNANGDPHEVIREAAANTIRMSRPGQDSFITPKLLLWDLLTIAYSDECYNDDESKLIQYFVSLMDVDNTVFLELESSMLAILDIEKEIKWIKTTDRPYLTIEAMVNELMDRRNVVFEGVKDLIAL